MISAVYFVSFESKIRNILYKIDELFTAAQFESVVDKGDKVAVKLHFGEFGNFRQIRPTFVARAVRFLKQLGAEPFLTDANSLGGSRSNAVGHVLTAFNHGFAAASMEAPIVVADGFDGHDYVGVEVDGKHFKIVRVAGAAYYSDSIISLAHFKGDLRGDDQYWAATLKNIGVGLAAKSGKAAIHLMSPPKITSKCNHCRRCLEWCPSDAIREGGSGIELVSERCSMCGDCVAFCPAEAVDLEWVFDKKMQEKYVEYAVGVLKGKEGKMGFVNFALDITPICDCAKWSGIPVLNDIGILASKDPVAVDQATFDLAMKQVDKRHSDGKWNHQLDYAEKLGLGTRQYKLIEV